MSNKEKIRAFLASNQGAFCDDCISAETGVRPRQNVNQICNGNLDIFRRNDRGVCCRCGKSKLTRSVENDRVCEVPVRYEGSRGMAVRLSVDVVLTKDEIEALQGALESEYESIKDAAFDDAEDEEFRDSYAANLQSLMMKLFERKLK